jgi:hypothetical protein
VLILGPDDSRVLALGLGAVSSPARDQVAFITVTKVQVIDADGSNGRQISSVPRSKQHNRCDWHGADGEYRPLSLVIHLAFPSIATRN